LYRVPVQSFDPSLGTRYSGAEGRPRRAGSSLEELSPLVGSRVLFPPSALPEELREEADGGEGVLLVGRLERVRAVGDALSAVVTVAGDDETCAIEPSVLMRPPTLDEGIGDARERAEQEEAAAGPRASLEEGGVGARGDPSHARPPPPPEASQAGPGGEDDDDDDGRSESVARVEYRAALGWEESELAARRALAERLEARRRAAPPQPEPEGMDRVLRRCEAVELADVEGRKVRERRRGGEEDARVRPRARGQLWRAGRRLAARYRLLPQPADPLPDLRRGDPPQAGARQAELRRSPRRVRPGLWARRGQVL